ncbi:Hypothetical predicted protein, partial [Olea europaea subsp. europaea]
EGAQLTHCSGRVAFEAQAFRSDKQLPLVQARLRQPQPLQYGGHHGRGMVCSVRAAFNRRE